MPQFSAVPSFRKVISTPMSGSIKWSSASQLTSRIHPLRFLWTSKGFISPESFLIFFLNLYILEWLLKSFKFKVLKSLVNTCVSQKIESVHFYSCSKQNSLRSLSLSPRQKEITHFSRAAFSEDLFFPNRKGGVGGGGRRIMELKKLPKLNLLWHWSQLLINSTIFATFTALVSVLLCHKLALSILKCEGSLT